MPFEFRDGALRACSAKGKLYFHFEASELVGVFFDDTFPDDDFGAIRALVIVTHRHGKRRVYRYDVWPHDTSLHEAIAAIRLSAPHLVLTELPVSEAASRLGVMTMEKRTQVYVAVTLGALIALCAAAFLTQ